VAFSDYNTNPDLNTTIGGINIAEGCPAGNLNNAVRLIAADGKGLANTVAGLTGTVNVPQSRTLTAAGLVTGGGDLAANRTFTVTAASSAEALTGTEAAKALTPAALGGIAKNFNADSGYQRFPGGFTLQWYRYRAVMTSETEIAVTFAMIFPTAVFSVVASPYLAIGATARDMWVQVISPSTSGCSVQVQADGDSGNRIDGFDLIALGY
jgi:hypothetical protein